MDTKRTLLITAWTVVGSIVGLVVFTLLLPVVGVGVLFLPILSLPPIVAAFPAGRYRRRNIYLPTIERFLASFFSVAILFLVVGAAATASDKEIGGSWPVYSVIGALEFIGIFFVLSVSTVKNK
jgi:hypothetical protein